MRLLQLEQLQETRQTLRNCASCHFYHLTCLPLTERMSSLTAMLSRLYIAPHRHTAAAPIAAAGATSGREGAVVRHFVSATPPRAARPWWPTGYAAAERSGRPPQVDVAAGRKGALSVFGLERNTQSRAGASSAQPLEIRKPRRNI